MLYNFEWLEPGSTFPPAKEQERIKRYLQNAQLFAQLLGLGQDGNAVAFPQSRRLLHHRGEIRLRQKWQKTKVRERADIFRRGDARSLKPRPVKRIPPNAVQGPPQPVQLELGQRLAPERLN